MSWAQRIIGDYQANFFTDYPSKVGYGYTNVEDRRRFGFNGSIGTTERTVWAGADGAGGEITATNANYLTTATALKFVSTSANDTSDGSGARQVNIGGLDADGLMASTTIATNGQTPVDVSGSWTENAFRMSVGAHTNRDAVCDGTLFLYAGDATAGVPDDETQVYSIVLPGKNQTLQCCDTVPADRVGFLRYTGIASFGNANAYASARPLIRPPGGVWLTKDELTIFRSTRLEPYSEVLDPLTNIEMRAVSSSGTLDVNARMFMWWTPINPS